MIELLIKAFGLAMALVFMIGPVFFSLIQTSMERGKKEAIFMAVGVSLSDAFYIVICYYGFSSYIGQYSQYTGYIGGGILILFGLYSIFKSRRKIKISNVKSVDSNMLIKYPLKGFFVNAANPFTIIFWLATVTAIADQYPSETELFLFFITVLLFIFLGDLTKVVLASKLKRLITVRFIRVMNILVGLILSGLGIRLLFANPENLQF